MSATEKHQMRILLAEDDPIQAQALIAMLSDYRVDIAQDGEQAWNLHHTMPYDLLLIDINLPGLNGITICQRLRKKGDLTPLLLVTANPSIDARVDGFNAGADDYIKKPVIPAELIARVKNALRRYGVTAGNTIETANIVLDYIAHTANYQATELPLTPKEFDILELLLSHPNRVFSRPQFIELLWPHDADLLDDSVKTHIKGLRQKLRNAGAPDVIENVRGTGYKFVVPRDIPTPSTNNTTSLQSLLDNTWQTYLPLIKNRVATLQKALHALYAHDLNTELRQQALESAHNLAGSLGMFKHSGAVDAVRRIESIFLNPDAAPDNKSLLDDLQILINVVASQGEEQKLTFSEGMTPSDNIQASILAVDDDPIFLSLCKDLLELAGMRVTTLTHISQFWNTLEELKPDLLLLDVDMPKSNGIDLCTTLRADAKWASLPLIFVTAHQEPAVIARLFDAMADDYISKPLVPEEFSSRVVKRLKRLTRGT